MHLAQAAGVPRLLVGLLRTWQVPSQACWLPCTSTQLMLPPSLHPVAYTCMRACQRIWQMAAVMLCVFSAQMLGALVKPPPTTTTTTTTPWPHFTGLGQ